MISVLTKVMGCSLRGTRGGIHGQHRERFLCKCRTSALSIASTRRTARSRSAAARRLARQTDRQHADRCRGHGRGYGEDLAVVTENSKYCILNEKCGIEAALFWFARRTPWIALANI